MSFLGLWSGLLSSVENLQTTEENHILQQGLGFMLKAKALGSKAKVPIIPGVNHEWMNH